MLESAWRDIITGGAGGPAGGMLRGLAWLASQPYSAVMRLRRWAYRRGVLPSRRPGDSAPAVICVGNLSVGGTGKTPMVAWAVKRLIAAGHRPAILTRGYRAVAGQSDEAMLLGQLCGAAVIVDPNRLRGARRAIADGATVLVMDDGFQHLRLRRDLDIVLIDATAPFGGGHCLPRGLLREPAAALADAGAIVITRSDAIHPGALTSLQDRLAVLAPAAVISTARHAPAAVIGPAGSAEPPESLQGRRVLAFCGLGNPKAFRDTLLALKADLAGFETFADHHAYTKADLDRLAGLARQAGADLLTTQKDFVKLTRLSLSELVLQLAIELQISSAAAQLETLVLKTAGEPGQRRCVPGRSRSTGTSPQRLP